VSIKKTLRTHSLLKSGTSLFVIWDIKLVPIKVSTGAHIKSALLRGGKKNPPLRRKNFVCVSLPPIKYFLDTPAATIGMPLMRRSVSLWLELLAKSDSSLSGGEGIFPASRLIMGGHYL